MSLFTIVYVSAARAGLRRPDVEAIVRNAREFNGSRGITGMLLHCDGSFMQALEGEESLLVDLYTGIRNDRRHSGVTTVIAEPLAEREFAGWALGFEDLRWQSEAEASQFGSRLATLGGRARSYRLLEGFRDRTLRAV